MVPEKIEILCKLKYGKIEIKFYGSELGSVVYIYFHEIYPMLHDVFWVTSLATFYLY